MSGKVIKLPNSTHYIRNVIPADAVAKTEMKLWRFLKVSPDKDPA